MASIGSVAAANCPGLIVVKSPAPAALLAMSVPTDPPTAWVAAISAFDGTAPLA